MTAKKLARETGDPTDFDETRRLLYMALLVNRTKRFNLAATLVNALAHHHLVSDITITEITEHVVNATSGIDNATETPEDATARTASLAWIQVQIDRITAELGDGPVTTDKNRSEHSGRKGGA
jgi:hypothetical protein